MNWLGLQMRINPWLTGCQWALELPSGDLKVVDERARLSWRLRKPGSFGNSAS